MKNERMDLVEGSIPSKLKEEIVHGVGIGYLGTSANPLVTAPTVCEIE
jgi:hypothetical protein